MKLIPYFSIGLGSVLIFHFLGWLQKGFLFLVWFPLHHLFSESVRFAIISNHITRAWLYVAYIEAPVCALLACALMASHAPRLLSQPEKKQRHVLIALIVIAFLILPFNLVSNINFGTAPVSPTNPAPLTIHE